MNTVNTYALSFATAATGTNQVFIGQSDVLMLFVPRLSTWYGSAVAAIRLRGSYSSSVSGITSYFYDYANKTPAEAIVTISTGGWYEVPNAGGPGFVSLQFDVATTQTTGLQLQTSRISY